MQTRRSGAVATASLLCSADPAPDWPRLQPKGGKFCQLETIDVLLPGQADLTKNLTFIDNKIAPGV